MGWNEINHIETHGWGREPAEAPPGFWGFQQAISDLGKLWKVKDRCFYIAFDCDGVFRLLSPTAKQLIFHVTYFAN